MERLVDKVLITACCVALLSLDESTGRTGAALCCLAVLVSATTELALLRTDHAGRARRSDRAHRADSPQATRWEAVALALSILPCLAALVFPQGLALVPLAAYDLARHRARWPLACAAIPFAAAGMVLASQLKPTALTSHAAQTALLNESVANPAGVLALALGLALIAITLSMRTTHNAVQMDTGRHLRDALREQTLALERANRDLRDRMDLEAQQAILAERVRIARDIHDNVGHLLTRATLQVEALRVVHADKPGVAADFADVGTTLSQALDTVRASVHDLRDESVDLSVQLRELAREVERDTGLSVDLEVSVERAPADVAACLLAIAREAASNTLRHSNARHLHVRCVEHPAFWQISVGDDGMGAVGASGSSSETGTRGAGRGMGLPSLRERVEALGGHFHAGPDQAAGGFKVFASIPKPAGPATPSAASERNQQ